MLRSRNFVQLAPSARAGALALRRFALGRLRRSLGLCVALAQAGALLACGTDFRTVTVEDRYAVELPDYLRSANDLHADASLQYKNEDREVYLVVFDRERNKLGELKLENLDLEGYSEVAAAAYEELLTDREIIDGGRSEQNGMPLYRRTVRGELRRNNTPVVLEFAAYETPERFYQLIAWTMAAREDSYGPHIERMLLSFHELDDDAAGAATDETNATDASETDDSATPGE